MLTWWSGPVDTAFALKSSNSISFIRVGPVLFAVRGIAPVGYAAFAFALGVTAGILIRRTVPAIAATLAAAAAVAIASALWIRPHLIAPVHALVTLTPADIAAANLAAGHGGTVIVMPPAWAVSRGTWLISAQTLDSAGHLFNAATVRACQANNQVACAAALDRLHLRDLITYQPAGRFWPLQWYETAIFLALAAMLAGICLWRIRRLPS
jgi:hypothetical protein